MRALVPLLLLPLAAARAEELKPDWKLINNSGAARFEQKDGVATIERTRGGGMDLLRADFPKAPAPGTEFLLKARVRGQGVGNGWFKIFFYDAQGNSLGQGRDVKPLHGTYDWKEVVLDQKAPEGTASCAVMVLLVQPGTLRIENLRIEPKAAAKKERVPLEGELPRWLDRNAIPVRSLNLDGDLSDLKALEKHLRGVRVVQLGENTHGDGLAFAAKCRLIRWLHERLGFDVVVFESGLYECDRATRLLKPGADPREVMKASIFPIWHTERTRPLFDYMVAQASTRSPMALSGVDLQQTGGLAERLIPEVREALRAIGSEAGADLDDPAALASIFATRKKELVAKLGEREFELLWRALDLRVAEAKYRALSGNEQLNFRDRWMAANLAWLATERYPKSKLVYWAATAHQAHGLGGIRKGGKPMYEGVTMAGVHAKKALGDKLYTIGFIAHGGWAGAWHRANFEVPAPAPDAVEALLYRYGKPYLFVPLEGAPFAWPAPMAPLGYARDMEADWSKVLDAVFYIEEMEPAKQMR